MMLAMFTPVIATSAIGRMAALVVDSLRAMGHDVVIVRTEDPRFFGDATHRTGSDAISWSNYKLVRTAIAGADATIFQIGNHHGFHQGALHWLPELRGIVCLHDFFLGHLFHGWAESHMPDAQGVLRAWYGDDVASRYFGLSNSADFIASTADIAPLTEWICAMALGVVTHSSWGCPRVLASCSGPVSVVPLAYDAPPAIAPLDSTDDERFRILTIGHVNSNKRIESVIEAIAGSATLRRSCIYRLVGDIQPDAATRLSVLAAERGVELIVSGALDDQQLALAIEQADAISCLRWPSLEAASASAIEAMLCGKPTIVTDVGFYSEIPADCSLKVDPAHEVVQLRAALEALEADPALRRTLGHAAQAWASTTFRADNYAGELVAIVERAARARPTLDAIQFFAETLRRWTGSADSLAAPLMAEALDIFSGQLSSGHSNDSFTHTRMP